MSEIRLVRVQPGPAPPAPTTIPPLLIFPDGEPPIEAVFCLFYWDGSHTDLVSVHRSLEAAQASYLESLGTSKPAVKERAALSWRLDPNDPEQATWNLVRPRMLDEFSGTFIERRKVEP